MVSSHTRAMARLRPTLCLMHCREAFLKYPVVYPFLCGLSIANISHLTTLYRLSRLRHPSVLPWQTTIIAYLLGIRLSFYRNYPFTAFFVAFLLVSRQKYQNQPRALKLSTHQTVILLACYTQGAQSFLAILPGLVFVEMFGVLCLETRPDWLPYSGKFSHHY